MKLDISKYSPVEIEKLKDRALYFICNCCVLLSEDKNFLSFQLPEESRYKGCFYLGNPK